MRDNRKSDHPKWHYVKLICRWLAEISGIIISCALGALVFFTLNNVVALSTPKKESILGLMVTVVSITFAILVTFIFSKLFSERQERIDRKSQIDKFSFRLNELRDIAYCLLNEPQIWKNYKETKKLDKDFPALSVFQFRSDGNEKYIGYEKYVEISENYGGETIVQAYLSLRELQNDFSARIDPLYVRDYTVNELQRFIECSRHVSYFLSEYKKDIGLTDTYNAIRVKNIQEAYFYLTGNSLALPEAIPQLSILFSNMAEIELRKLQYFLFLNSRPPSTISKLLWINLIVYLLTLIGALFQTILLETYSTTYVICLVSWFIGNTISLTITMRKALKFELKITEYITLNKEDAQTKLN